MHISEIINNAQIGRCDLIDPIIQTAYAIQCEREGEEPEYTDAGDCDFRIQHSVPLEGYILKGKRGKKYLGSFSLHEETGIAITRISQR